MKSGARAERTAARLMQERGLLLVQANYRCRYGEIDLIMRDGEMLVFLEVRLRSSNDFGGAAASIDRHKQAKLIRSAQDYLAKFPQYPPCRFDALLLVTPEGESGFEWIKNAFEV